MFLERGNDNLTFDPQVDGYTSGVFFNTVAGTPAVTSNVLRLNTASVYTLARFTVSMDMEFVLTVPTDPTSGDVRKWGLFLPSLGDRGACYFEIAGDKFYVRFFDNAGVELLSQEVAWDSGAWTGNPIAYRIAKTDRGARFYVDGTQVAQQTMPETTPLKTVNIPLAVGIKNNNADNLDLTSLTLLS